MRISKETIKYFKNSLLNNSDKLYLFGSRTDDKKLGGDIDICILSSEKYTIQQLDKISINFMKQFGWQKLDLKNWTFNEKNSFKDLVMDSAIEL